jgi:hypothetical protein
MILEDEDSSNIYIDTKNKNDKIMRKMIDLLYMIKFE